MRSTRFKLLIASTLAAIALSTVHLQASAANDTPTPQQFLGFRVGEDKKLARWDKIVEYMRLIATGTGRVRLRELGKSTNNNPFILLEISSPDTLQNLDRFKQERNELIGHCGLQFIHVTPDIEVTYGLAKTYWRMGFASEAARACLRYGFEQLELERIYALAEPPNIGSKRVMERVGMRYNKTEYYKDDLYEGDLVFYLISADEHQHDG